jgi:hypothetical protein
MLCLSAAFLVPLAFAVAVILRVTSTYTVSKVVGEFVGVLSTRSHPKIRAPNRNQDHIRTSTLEGAQN